MLLEKGKKILFDTCALDPSRVVIAGVSGGADSIAMLDMLVKLNLNVCVAHLNHQLRPTASRDAQFVAGIAENYGVECISGEADVIQQAQESGEGIEEAARNARYRFLFELAEQKKAAAVLTAHQADDQVETILQNILRGAGLKGLSGMQPCSISAYHKEIPLVRPLLECLREEILEYCAQENLEYMTDESNTDTKYRRNRIRLELIPELETYNPRIKDALLRMGEIINTDKDFIDGYLQEIINGGGVTFSENSAEISVQMFAQYPAAVQRILVKNILERCFPDENTLGFLQYENARKFIARGIKSTGMQLNDQIALRLEKDVVVIMPAGEIALPVPAWPNVERSLRVKIETGEAALGSDWKMELAIHPIEKIGKSYLENTDPYQAYLDADILGKEEELEVRKWQPGDRFQPLGMRGKSIKLSDFWINNKVPERSRKHWPLIFCGSDLVWIPGFQPSEEAKITAKTRQVLSIRVYRE